MNECKALLQIQPIDKRLSLVLQSAEAIIIHIHQSPHHLLNFIPTATGFQLICKSITKTFPSLALDVMTISTKQSQGQYQFKFWITKLTHPPSLLSPTCNLLCFIGKLQLILQNNIKLLNFFYQLLQPILNLLYVNTTIISRYERIKKLINFKIKSIQEPFKRVLHFLCMFVYVYLLRVLDVYVLHVHVLSVVCVASTFVACKCVYFCTSIFN